MCHRLEAKGGSVLLLDDTDGRIVLDKAVYGVRTVQRDIDRSARCRQYFRRKADDRAAVQGIGSVHCNRFSCREIEVLLRCRCILVADELHRTAYCQVSGPTEINRTARRCRGHRRVLISAVISHHERVMTSLFSVCGELDRSALNAERTRRGIFKHHPCAERKGTGAVLQHEVAAAVSKV